MSTPRRRLHRRIMLAFAGFTALVALVFGLYVVVFAYSVEDLFFAAMLEEEADARLRHRERHGDWGRPQHPGMRVIEDASSLPDGIGPRLLAEPERTEFAGRDGRHYHLRALVPPGGAPHAWLLAEVSGQLVVRPRRGDLFGLLAWSGAIMIALALLLGHWLARRIAAPLARLASRVDDAAPERLPHALAEGCPDDETGVLARALDRLVARIEAFVVREREFTRDASHELRTPLAVIRSAAELLSREAGLSASGRDQVEHVLQSARQLEQTVDTLLSLAREEGDARHDASAAVALLPVLERVIVEQSPWLGDKPVEVEIDVPAHTRIAVSPGVLHILLANLVGNAFAHTREGTVRIEVGDGRLRIANPGAGPREIDFEPHVRGGDSAGFGLGLAIVRRLCERHGIDLWFGAAGGATVATLGLVPASGQVAGDRGAAQDGAGAGRERTVGP